MEKLSKLFGSPGKLKVLRLFMFNQNETFTASDVAARTSLSATVVRRELSDLTALGLLKKRGVRTKTNYRVNPAFEHLNALDVFIRETTNVRPKEIVAALRRAGTLRLVILAGTFSGVPEAQVDLLVVGDSIDERALGRAVKALEAELGREIRYASFATADFRYRLGVYDRLIRDIFDYPHRLLLDKIGL